MVWSQDEDAVIEDDLGHELDGTVGGQAGGLAQRLARRRSPPRRCP